MGGMQACKNAPTITSASVPSSQVCPKCGTNKQNGKRSCCARGGSWFNNCGDVGDSTFEHTWGEGIQACKDAPTTTSASVPNSKVCPQCGTNKKNGKRSCCASGGSWFEKCGAPGDSTFEHTWSEGAQACQSLELAQAILSHEEAILPRLSNISIVEQTPTRESTDIYVPGG